jgi:hypothetical protein
MDLGAAGTLGTSRGNSDKQIATFSAAVADDINTVRNVEVDTLCISEGEDCISEAEDEDEDEAVGSIHMTRFFEGTSLSTGTEEASGAFLGALDAALGSLGALVPLALGRPRFLLVDAVLLDAEGALAEALRPVAALLRPRLAVSGNSGNSGCSGSIHGIGNLWKVPGFSSEGRCFFSHFLKCLTVAS